MGTARKFILLIFLWSILPLGCCIFDSCGCGASRPTRYGINGITIKSTNADSQILNSNQSYTFDQYFKVFSFDLATLTIAPIESNGFIPAAYACSPPPPDVRNNIREFEIIADNTFDLGSGSISPGEHISDYFGFAYYQFYQLTPFTAFEAYTEYVYSNQIVLGLLSAPSHAVEMELTFRITLEDETVFEFDELMKVSI